MKNKIFLNIRFYRRQFYFLVFTALFLAGAIGGYAYYRLYYLNFHDTSTNGSEIKEIYQNTIPADVQKAINIEVGKGNQQSFRYILPTAPSSANLISPPLPTGKIEPTATPAIPITAAVRIPILMYHYIEYVADRGDKTRISLSTTPYTLEEQVKTLISAGYTFITNSELIDILDGKRNLPTKPIVLTFDDSYRDFYTDAFPILKKYNVRATQYVIAGFLDRPNHMTVDQVKEIIQSGLVEIGAHTIHHRWLKGLKLKDVSPEIFQAKIMLEREFNIHIESFAYPFGAFDEETIRIVKEAGYRSAASTIPGIEQSHLNRYFLFRLRPGARTGKTLLTFLDQQKFNPW